MAGRGRTGGRAIESTDGAILGGPSFPPVFESSRGPRVSLGLFALAVPPTATTGLGARQVPRNNSRSLLTMATLWECPVLRAWISPRIGAPSR
jgi:hypothetical protein